MWYNVDFNRWVVQLLPPILRSKVLIVLLKIMVLPLAWLHAHFVLYRKAVSDRLNVTASVQDIERVLNEAFFLHNRQIYLEDVNNEQQTCLYFVREAMAAVFMNPSLLLYQQGEVSDKPNFIVCIPTFLCTSLDKDEDKYKGRYLGIIINLIEYYKPAGKRYGIKLYDYE